MPAPSRKGEILAGRFVLDAELGQGGMGAVYLATDRTIGRRVAIKLLRPEVAEDPDNLERLREEAYSLASLHHPNVVQLYDFVVGGRDATFMVMELVEGESLSKKLKAHPMLPIGLAVDYTLELLSALAAAHAKGIIHRDIKPANLLVLSLPARRDMLKVLDFGIAKLTEATIRRNPTTAGILLGTPSYMSPEQASGKPIDARTDVYSAGLVLYRMLTGHNPFEGFDLAQTLVRVQHIPAPPLQEMRLDAPPHIVQAVMRAVAKSPEERFGSALELAEALRAQRNATYGAGATYGPTSHRPPEAATMDAPHASSSQLPPTMQATAPWSPPATSGPVQYTSSIPTHAGMGMQPPAPAMTPPAWAPPSGPTGGQQPSVNGATHPPAGRSSIGIVMLVALAGVGVIMIALTANVIITSYAGRAVLGTKSVHGATDWDGAQPFTCNSGDKKAWNVTASFKTGSAITVEGTCRFACVGCNITAPTAITVRGKGMAMLMDRTLVTATTTIADLSDDGGILIDESSLANGPAAKMRDRSIFQTGTGATAKTVRASPLVKFPRD